MGGELCNHIIKAGAFSEELCRHYFKQLLKTVNYMHSKGIAHLDLKPENIMLDEKTFDTKLIDFGFATPISVDYSTKHQDFKGTQMYMAPEMHRGKYEADKADLFAVGVILFCMRAGTCPYVAKSSIKDPIYREIIVGDQFK